MDWPSGQSFLSLKRVRGAWNKFTARGIINVKFAYDFILGGLDTTVKDS
jgi:hypothetical protein